MEGGRGGEGGGRIVLTRLNTICLKNSYVLPLCGGYISFKKTCDNIFFNVRIKTVIYKIDDDLFLLVGHSHGIIFSNFSDGSLSHF